MLSSDQISDFRADIGDQLSPYAFTDTELQRLYTRKDENYDRALLLAIDQLLANAAKLYDYTAGYTRMSRDQVFNHLMDLRKLIAARANQTVQIVGLRVVPQIKKD